MKHDKMRKMAGSLYTLINVLKVICLLLSSIVFVLGVVVVFVKDSVFHNALLSLDLGNVTLKFTTAGELDVSDVRIQIIIGIAAFIILLLTIAYGLKLVLGILLPMKEGHPFTNVVSDNTKKLGKLVLIGGSIYTIVGNIGFKLSMNSYNLMSYVDPARVADVQINSNIHLSYIIFALVLFLMSYVFKYGEELQQESDETL